MTYRPILAVVVFSVLASSEPPQDGSRGATPTVRVAWMRDRTCQFVFHAVLEGLYADGVSNDVVDRVLDVDPVTKRSRYRTHFVDQCPLCQPTFEAFRLYRSRESFIGFQERVDTFGPGLELSLRQKLMSEKIDDRMEAIRSLSKRWVAARLDSMRLTPKERNEWAQRLEERQRQGMEALQKAAFTGRPAGFKGRPICDGSAEACPLK